MKVVIAGASGFVGHELVKRLVRDPSIMVRALARSLKDEAKPNFETRTCDLFSLLDVEHGLVGQQQAIYLVHSMLPSSQLTQGSFADYDLILADNFARAAKKNNLQRIIYLGGIIPEDKNSHPEELSLHLRSRLEVENIFRSYKIPVLSLRAGIIMGKEGSSFQMLLRLVLRLPFMVFPAWTQSQTSPIHVRDVAETMHYALQHPALEGSFDLDSGQSLSYADMLKRTAEGLHKKRWFVNVPYFSPHLSKLWVTTITGAPKNLVYPLVDSLQHDMRPAPEKSLKLPNWKYTTFEDALEEVSEDQASGPKRQPKAYKKPIPSDRARVVQSVQRFTIPPGKNAEWASLRFVAWLNKNLRGLVNVQTQDNKTTFFFLGTKKILLELTMAKDRSSNTRILFYITGGLLAQETKRGRLEFRVTPDGKSLITAIHDFKPELPWYLYKYSQAIFHASVMRRFGKSLVRDSDPKLISRA